MSDPASPERRPTAAAAASPNELRRAVTLGGPPAAGGRIGDYRTLRVLGEGGTAIVYLAEHVGDGRQVALKLPHIIPGAAAMIAKRLQREAKAAQAIRHPHVCEVYEAGEHEGRIFLAMRYVEGCTLSQWLQQAPEVPVERATDIVAKLARGLQAAHDVGILHRDVKSSNIMIDACGEPILTDFGLARWTEAQHTVLTLSGSIVGTPGYMAPEQITGSADDVGPAADVYSLGVVLYELTTGWLPFSGNLATVLGSIVSDPPPPLATHVPQIDPRLEAICLRALAKLPSERFASAADLARALETWTSGGPLELDVVDVASPQSASSTSPAASPPPQGATGKFRQAWRGWFARKR